MLKINSWAGVRFTLRHACVALAIFFIIPIILYNFYEEQECYKHGNITENRTEWVFLDNCYYKENREVYIKQD